MQKKIDEMMELKKIEADDAQIFSPEQHLLTRKKQSETKEIYAESDGRAFPPFQKQHQEQPNHREEGTHDNRPSFRVCPRCADKGTYREDCMEHWPIEDQSGEWGIVAPNQFDVICEASGQELKRNCDHTGNARLNVMLDSWMERYEASNLDGKQVIAQEVVRSIYEDASSLFLRSDEPSGMHKPMSRECATACVRRALNASHFLTSR